MKILFIGGTGQISTAVTSVIKHHHDVTLLNRGTKVVEGTKQLTVDINDSKRVKEIIDSDYDCVVNWIAFTDDDVIRDYEIFKGRTKQYIFISSASAYEKPVQDYPITEETPLTNPYWEYSRNKIYAEDFLNSIHSKDFNVTIIRPSHTYDNTKLMFALKEYGSEYTLLKRIIDGKPYIIPDAGTSIWTITHSTDFAKGFIPLLGNEKAYGEAFHITSEFHYTWEQLYNIICSALKVKPNPIHIPTAYILKHFPEKEGEFLGDKHWSVFFDNSKVKKISVDFECTTRYEDVVEGVIKYYLETESLHGLDIEFEGKYQNLIDEYIMKTQ